MLYLYDFFYLFICLFYSLIQQFVSNKIVKKILLVTITIDVNMNALILKIYFIVQTVSRIVHIYIYQNCFNFVI